MRDKRATLPDIFLGIFAHMPWWMKSVLIVRNLVATWCRLDAPSAAEVLHVRAKDSYRVGEKIGLWPIFHLDENELVVGRNNKHLDFRLSLVKLIEGENASIVVSTVCSVHNLYGKIYLFFIVPFHERGVQRLITNALAPGRI